VLRVGARRAAAYRDEHERPARHLGDLHAQDARAPGETEQRIYALPSWRETPHFIE